MKKFGGPAVFLDKNDINTDEIIPAKHLTEISKSALQPYIMEDLQLDGFKPGSTEMTAARVVVTKANFGCGSSREHAVWVLEVNDINVVIAKSFARIFRQNMFNCGMLAVELVKDDIDILFGMGAGVKIAVDIDNNSIKAISADQREETFSFTLNDFDRDLIVAGGWLAYADVKY